MSQYQASDAEVIKAWERTLNAQVVDNAHCLIKVGNGGLAGRNVRGQRPEYAICYDSNLQGSNGGKGDEVTHTCAYALSGVGVAAADKLEGREVRGDTATFKMSLDNWRNGVYRENPMDLQRVAFNKWKSDIEWLALNRARTLTAGLLMHLAGYKGLASADYTDDGGVELDPSLAQWNINNTITEIGASNITRASANYSSPNATDQAVAADGSAYPTKAHLDRLVLDLASRKHLLRPPITSNGMSFYPVLYDQHVSHHLNSDSNWTNINSSLLQGGYIKDNPIFTGADFVYKNLAFYPIQSLLPRGYNSSTFASISGVRRCIVLGAGAGVIAPGLHYTPTNLFTLQTGSSDGGFRQYAHAISMLGAARPEFTDPNDTSITHSNCHVWVVRV